MVFEGEEEPRYTEAGVATCQSAYPEDMKTQIFQLKERLFSRTWRKEFVVLYEDSTLAWFKDQLRNQPEGGLLIQDAPELMAVGAFTLRVPTRPDLPGGTHIRQLMAFGVRNKTKVHWFLASNEDEVADWMTAISNTLPLPPQVPVYVDTDDQNAHIYESVDILPGEVPRQLPPLGVSETEPVKREGSSVLDDSKIVTAPAAKEKDGLGN